MSYTINNVYCPACGRFVKDVFDTIKAKRLIVYCYYCKIRFEIIWMWEEEHLRDVTERKQLTEGYNE